MPNNQHERTPWEVVDSVPVFSTVTSYRVYGSGDRSRHGLSLAEFYLKADAEYAVKCVNIISELLARRVDVLAQTPPYQELVDWIHEQLKKEV